MIYPLHLVQYCKLSELCIYFKLKILLVFCAFCSLRFILWRPSFIFGFKSGIIVTLPKNILCTALDFSHEFSQLLSENAFVYLCFRRLFSLEKIGRFFLCNTLKMQLHCSLASIISAASAIQLVVSVKRKWCFAAFTILFVTMFLQFYYGTYRCAVLLNVLNFSGFTKLDSFFH